MSENKVNSFQRLYDINVSEQLKEKIGLKYLSWAYAWGILKTAYPEATYQVYTREIHLTEQTEIVDKEFNSTKTITTDSVSEIPYFTDGKTCFVKVGVTVEGREEVELLPVMDNRNNAVPVSGVTMTLVNKAIQRAFVKACARHGLGLYVYAGEDLPDAERKSFAAIDYEGIKSAALSMDANCSEEMFNQRIEEIKDCLLNANLPEDVLNRVTTFIMEQTNKKISALMFDDPNDILVAARIWKYINLLKGSLNGTTK